MGPAIARECICKKPKNHSLLDFLSSQLISVIFVSYFSCQHYWMRVIPVKESNTASNKRFHQPLRQKLTFYFWTTHNHTITVKQKHVTNFGEKCQVYRNMIFPTYTAKWGSRFSRPSEKGYHFGGEADLCRLFALYCILDTFFWEVSGNWGEFCWVPPYLKCRQICDEPAVRKQKCIELYTYRISLVRVSLHNIPTHSVYYKGFPSRLSFESTLKSAQPWENASRVDDIFLGRMPCYLQV